MWYTPEPVVNFIVRAVDDILKTEFGLPQGLADTSKTKIKRIVETKATAEQRSKIKRHIVEQEVHKVQILDPATGTFLAEVVKQIHQKFAGQQGMWSGYVEDHLIPRLNGFELLMASYAMAHLKLDCCYVKPATNPKKNNACAYTSPTPWKNTTKTPAPSLPVGSPMRPAKPTISKEIPL